jgi:hypothetical protein
MPASGRPIVKNKRNGSKMAMIKRIGENLLQ